MAVFMALLQPGDTFMGMALDQGGHLTHGSPANQSGKWFKVVSYGLKPDTHLIDYEQMEALARQHKPKLIVAGASAYSRHIDWARFRKVADEIGAWFMVDMAHYAGLVAAGVYPSPLPHAHVVTTTTHKTLRGPARRHGAVERSGDRQEDQLGGIPGLQGGPLMHIIAAKAVAFGEALQPEFKVYARDVIDNAQALAAALTERGLKIISGGTDSHVMLVDPAAQEGDRRVGREGARPRRHHRQQEQHPGDPEKFTVTSGVRLGSPAGTTRGFGVAEFRQIGHLIADVLDRNRQERPGRRCPGRGPGASQGARALFPLSHLPRLTQAQSHNGGNRCAVHFAVTRTHRSKTRGRPTTIRRSGGGATARRAGRASPLSSACSCASSPW